MPKHLIIRLILITILIYSSVIYSERPHEHGKANGTIIIDKSKAILEVKIPALSVIGFEYHPKSKKEREKVNHSIERFKKLTIINLHTKKPFGRFKNISTKIKSTSIAFESSKEDVHHHHHHDKKQPKSKDIHSEFVIKQEIEFKKKEAIHLISSDLFLTIPDLHELSLIIISGNDQKHVKLNPDNNKAKLITY